jgi:hypothetical protein
MLSQSAFLFGAKFCQNANSENAVLHSQRVFWEVFLIISQKSRVCHILTILLLQTAKKIAEFQKKGYPLVCLVAKLA